MSKRCKILHIALLLFLLTGCYDSHNMAEHTDESIAPNSTIATLRALSKRDKAVIHNEDIVINGVVTSDDSEGNFYRTLFIEDETAAAEIFVGFYDICAIYPPYSKISLKLNGCATYIENGTLQIGLPSESFSMDKIDYFYTSVVADKYMIRHTGLHHLEAKQLNIAQLGESFCGRLIGLSSLRHAPHTSEDITTIAGYHRYIDGAGNELYVYVSEYANFADIDIPKQIVSIIGILSYKSVGYNIGKQFVVTPRRADDIITM